MFLGGGGEGWRGDDSEPYEDDMKSTISFATASGFSSMHWCDVPGITLIGAPNAVARVRPPETSKILSLSP